MASDRLDVGYWSERLPLDDWYPSRQRWAATPLKARRPSNAASINCLTRRRRGERHPAGPAGVTPFVPTPSERQVWQPWFVGERQNSVFPLVERAKFGVENLERGGRGTLSGLPRLVERRINSIRTP